MDLMRMFGFKAEPKPINTVLQRLSKRAERLNPKQQSQAFVSIGGIDEALRNPDNRIIFGRRGTGKTHLLAFMTERARKEGDISAYVDLRSIGSNGSLYSDESLPPSERGTRLLRDFLEALHDGIYESLTSPHSKFDPYNVQNHLDELQSAVRDVLVTESFETKKTAGTTEGERTDLGVEGKISATGPAGSARASAESRDESTHSEEIVERGSPKLSVNVGTVHRPLKSICDKTGRRLWLYIDEWSAIPEPIQPYLADFLKRAIFPVNNVSVQIASIEQRSRFRIGHGAETVGLELGSDVFADVNLDDYYVYEKNPAQAVNFFRDMMFRHLQASSEKGELEIRSSNELISAAFTQENAFKELIRACEGVPRDAINILQMAARRAEQEKISVPMIRLAAKDWFERDKEHFLETNPKARAMLHWIVDEVIRGKRVRAFLVESSLRDETLERLFDERLLHIARRSYSAKDSPGVRYRVWKVDYGCYVDLIPTADKPKGFLFEDVEAEGDGTADVPEDDYRAVRRAILDLSSFESRWAEGAFAPTGVAAVGSPTPAR